jgi:hypothetical protein
MDPEIEAIASMSAALEGLEPDARARVLRWAGERYGVKITLSVAPPTHGGGGDDAIADDPTIGAITDEEIVAEAPAFDHFAELFAAAQPKTNEDKALVAAYWLQVIKGGDKWQSTTLQKELKNMGHAIPNITDALTSNMKKKPQRVIQLAKSGSAKQARKTYKVTHEGLAYVQGMLGHGG